jgi:uncharacterized protein (TIGR02186 family)
MRSGVWGWPAIVWCLPMLLVLCLAGVVRAESVTVQVTPDVVEINSFFQGHNVTVTGTLPTGLGAVVEVVGPTAEEHLRRKGRRGPLWMNVGNITVDGAPSLYLVLSSAADLLAGNLINAAWGFPALIQRISLKGDVQENEKDKFKQQFLELKESEQLYAAWPGGLKVSPAEDGRLKVTGTFWLPANVKPDTYKVCLTAVKEGQAVGRLCTDLTVQMVGFPAFLMTMAYEHAALYGILAVVIAIVVGFIMGYLFKGGGGH